MSRDEHRRWRGRPIALLMALALVAISCTPAESDDILGDEAAADPDEELADDDDGAADDAADDADDEDEGDEGDEAAAEEDEGADDAPAEVDGDGAEAPELAEQVEAGDLPPLEERLPSDPLVVEPEEEVGTYGGTWNMVMLGYTDSASLHNVVGYEPMVRWDREWNQDPIAGVAHDWEFNDEGTEYTFYLREGIHWSDGEPYTTEDIEFGFDAVMFNEDITPAPPGWLRNPDGDVPELEIIDDYTFSLTWPSPYGTFLDEMASFGHAGQLSRYPKHYLEQFHADYNDDVDELVDVQGASDWVELFQQHGTSIEGTQHDARFANTDLPTINAWILNDPLGEGTQVTYERNPYYWKVDSEGNQLPYIDELVYDVVEEQEAVVLRAANGDIDWQERNLQELEARSTLAENQESGDYELFETHPSAQTHTTVNFNLNHQDEGIREMFQDTDFRIAMSHAINREEINDLVYFGLSEPWQTGPVEESRFYREDLAKQYTEFDPDLASEMLDDAGYEMGDDGLRLDPEGRPIDIEIAVTPQWRAEHVDVAELIVGYWDDVGVDAHVSTMDRPLHTERRVAGEMDVHLFSGEGGLHDEILRTRKYVPRTSTDYAPLWALWWQNPTDEAGEEPPEDHPARVQFDLLDDIMRTPDRDEQDELMNELLDIAVDEFWLLGIGSEPQRTGVQRNNFHNVPEVIFQTPTWPTPGPADPAQFFISDDS